MGQVTGANTITYLFSVVVVDMDYVFIIMYRLSITRVLVITNRSLIRDFNQQV